MDSIQASNNGGVVEKEKEVGNNNYYASMVDPFLVEALQNPRHRLTDLGCRMSSIMRMDIQKFDGEISFNLWKVQMRAVLIQHGLWKVLKGPHVKPEKTTEEQWAAELKKRRGSLTEDEWEELELKAVAAIQLCLAPHVLREVLDKVTAVDLWNRLEELYMTKSLANKIRLKERLYTFRMAEVLRMELDIQKFLQNPEQLQFEFQHFPTSYLRLAAHRVAQHYGLRTMVLDNLTDGPGNKIVVRKTETKFPSVRLSDVPAKQPENSKHEQVKIAMRRRPNRTSSGDASDMGTRNSALRSVEERKEEYDRARARIFRSPGSSSTEEMVSLVVANGKGPCPSKDETIACRDVIGDSEKSSSVSDMESSFRVAIFKDREKDRADPDYDRNYERYVKNFPTSHRILMPFNMPKFQAPFLQYEASFPQMGQIPRAQPSLNYGPSPDPSISHYCTLGTNHASRDAIYMQWPSPAMMYAHSYGPFRQSVLQVIWP